jgi:hypothetical protein
MASRRMSTEKVRPPLLILGTHLLPPEGQMWFPTFPVCVAGFVENMERAR